MIIRFNNNNPEKIIETIYHHLSKRKLGSIIDLSLKDDLLNLTISKLGKSNLQFSVKKCDDDQTEICLVSKKIALTHKTLEKELVKKLTEVIEMSGATIVKPYD